MRHFIRSGIMGLVLTLSSFAAERDGNSPDINYVSLGQYEQQKSVAIDLRNPNADQGNDQDSSSFEERRAPTRPILPLCLAQIVGKTRLCYICSSMWIPQEQRSNSDNVSFLLNTFCSAGGFAGLTAGGVMLGIHGISPLVLGVTISGSILSSPYIFGAVSELMYWSASCLGKDDFVRDADDVRDFPCCLPDWTGHLNQGSNTTKNWLGWFCTPCCGSTTLNDDLL